MGSSIRISVVAFFVWGCTYSSITLPVSPPVAATCYVASITWDGGGDPLLYTYDTNHLLLPPLDATGNPIWTVVYDQDDKRAVLRGTRVDTLFFDVIGRLIKRVVSYDSGKNVGEVHSFSYNSMGQLQSSVDVYFIPANPVPGSMDTTTYEYPDTDSHNYTKTTRKEEPGNALGITLYSYDNRNNPMFVSNYPFSLWYDPTITTNNVTRLETVGGYNHVENYSFTYNEYSYPATRSGVNENNGAWKEYYTYIDCHLNP